MRPDDHPPGRDKRRHNEEDPAETLVDEVDAEGDPEGGACVVARGRRIVGLRLVVDARMRLISAWTMPDEVADDLVDPERDKRGSGRRTGQRSSTVFRYPER